VSPNALKDDPDRPLLPGAAGDVVAARNIARRLLRPANGPAAIVAEPGLATLVLTAACLHCTQCSDEEASQTDLATYLAQLVQQRAIDPAMMRSPLQFVRYAAAELQALPLAPRQSLLRDLLKIVSRQRPSQATKSPKSGDERENSQNIT